MAVAGVDGTAMDAELEKMLGIERKERKPQACSECGSESHTARTCTHGDEDANQPR
jgi:hypothetical protein